MDEDVVAIGSCDSYKSDIIKDFLYKGLKRIGFEIKKSKVLLKPNLLSAKSAEKAVTTHPDFVRSVAEVFIDHSCDVYIGDSPGYESTKKVLKHGGIMDVVKTHGLKIRSFDMKIKKIHEGISPYREFLLGDDPDDYDYVINIPKLKTHAMMGLTLGVKNTFGFIPSLEKAKWHLKAGRDVMLFASLLIDIYNIIKPALNIMDGIVGMDGEGPSGGRVKFLGFVGISKNAFNLDYLIEKKIGLTHSLPISTLAIREGLIKEYDYSDVSSITNYEHNKIENNFIDFQMPSTINTDWNLPRIAKQVLSDIFVKKPKFNINACKKCNICISVCPAKALTESGKSIVVDYGKCIRCYCCHEMCPEGAIKLM